MPTEWFVRGRMRCAAIAVSGCAAVSACAASRSGEGGPPALGGPGATAATTGAAQGGGPGGPRQPWEADSIRMQGEEYARRVLYGLEVAKVAGPAANGLTRSTVAALQSAEALAAVELGPDDYPHEALRGAWRKMLSRGPDGDQPDARAGGSEARRDSAAGSLHDIRTRAFDRLRRRMDTRSGRLGAYVVFNPLGWDRGGTVRVALPSADSAGATIERTVHLARVPALGATVIPVDENGLPVVVTPTAPPVQFGGTWMENGYLRVEVDPRTGAITRLFDRLGGHEALRPGGRANQLRPPRGRVDEATGRPAEEDTEAPTARVRSISGAVTAGQVTMQIEREWHGSIVRQELSLGRDAPFLEIATEIEPAGTERTLRIIVEPGVAPDSAALGLPYGADLRPGSPARTDPVGSREGPGDWIDVSRGGRGLSVLTDGRHRWEYGGGSLEMVYEASSDRAAEPAADGRPHRFRFALYPHVGDWRQGRTHLLAAEYVTPLLAAHEPRHRGPLGESFSLVRSDDENVSVAWVKRAEDDADVLVLRVVEWFGTGGETRVGVACPRVSARRSDVREEPGEALPAAAGAFRIALRPNEVATVRALCSN